jgi:uncharacterized SAM-dependent methyltransferase
VHIGPPRFAFLPQETVRTEYSYKYDVEEFGSLAAAAGWTVEQVWTDERRLFGVLYLAAV